jgi:methyltransferase (TIGR00027 family)
MNDQSGAGRRGASRTAISVAALRAAHQFLDGEPRLLDDPVAVRLLGPSAFDHLRSRTAELMRPAVQALRSHVVLRSRIAEDRLAAAATRGVTQYVVLGAGFDTFAYRQPAWASRLRIFEVDHPESQAAKIAALASAGVTVPSNVTFIPVDFEREALAYALGSSQVDLARPAFFSWLGVMVYVEAAAADEVFRLVASRPASSEIVFTFAPQPDPSEGPSRLAALAGAVGEPWRTFVEPEELLRKLREWGFSEAELLTPDDAAARYFSGRTDGLPPPRHPTIGWAVV